MITALRDAALMHEHGMRNPLPANTLLGTAVRDLAKRESAFRTKNGDGVRYAFLGAHVRACKGSVIRLLEKAVKGIERGRLAHSLNTRRIYESKENLTEAIQIAKDRNLA